jgi:hypothetical protein
MIFLTNIQCKEWPFEVLLAKRTHHFYIAPIALEQMLIYSLIKIIKINLILF